MYEMLQDPAFYTYEPGSEIAWPDPEDSARFYVARVGEMRIHAKTDPTSDNYEVIRYTDQLPGIGITDDKSLAEWDAKGEEVFEWVNNSWFEVHDNKDDEYFSEPIFSLNEAIALAQSLYEKYGDTEEVGEAE